MPKPRIILIDDNQAFLDLFLSLPETGSFDIFPIKFAKEAFEILAREYIDLIIADIQMPGMSGIDLFKKVQDLYPDIPVILITAFGSTEAAIQMVKQGAFHYFEKPIVDKLDLLWTTIREAAEKRKILKEVTSLRKEKYFLTEIPSPIIGRSNGIKAVRRDIKEITHIPVTVLISGETGTGKDLIARNIHDASDRKHHSFIAINCNQFAPGVLESELFGHEKGAFTGALERNIGLFESTHRGTLFLDEISGASANFQSKLLRVLETKSFTRVGGTAPIYSDFRIIAATDRDLGAEVEEGRFRKDLYFRLNVYAIDIPPLRSRKEDIPLIAEYYLKKFCHTYDRRIDGFSERATTALWQYDWPGNVRELINIIERAVIICKESMVTTKHLPFSDLPSRHISNLSLKEMEKLYIELAMKNAHNNKSKAAELLGISRKTLIAKLKRYELSETEQI